MNNIEQLQKIFEFILNGGIPGIIIATIVLGNYIVKDFPKLLESLFKSNELLSNFKEKEINNLKKALESNYLSKETKEAYLEQIDRKYFEKLYGISTSKKNRIILNNLIKEYNELEWHDIKIAYSYFNFSQNHLSITIDRADKLWFKFWRFFKITIGGYLLFFNIVLIYNLFFNINASSFDELLKLFLVLFTIIILFN